MSEPAFDPVPLIDDQGDLDAWFLCVAVEGAEVQEMAWAAALAAMRELQSDGADHDDLVEVVRAQEERDRRLHGDDPAYRVIYRMTRQAIEATFEESYR